MLQNVLEFLATKEVYSEAEIYYTPTLAGNIVLFLLAAILFVVMAAFGGARKKFQVKQLAFSAMAVTLAVVLSFIKPLSLPYGGSVTFFSMLFICFIGYLYGTRAGILTGIAYGFLQLIIEPSIMHPVQLLLDYPIAFGCLGLAGAFRNSRFGIVKGYILGIFGRYVSHLISGYVFFAMYTPEGWNPFIYSTAYNASYIVPEAALTVIILFIPVVRNGLNEVKRMATEN